jgi:hypothetical protein
MSSQNKEMNVGKRRSWQAGSQSVAGIVTAQRLAVEAIHVINLYDLSKYSTWRLLLAMVFP